MKKLGLLVFFTWSMAWSVDFFWDIQKAKSVEVVQSIPEYQSFINWTQGKIRSEVKLPYTPNADANIGKTRAKIESEIREELRERLMKTMGYIQISDIFLLRDYYSLQTQIRNELIEAANHAFYYPLVQEKGFMKGMAELDFFGPKGIAQIFFRDRNRISLSNYIRNQRDILWYDGIVIDVFLYPQFLPSLQFRVYDEDDNLIYGPEVVDDTVLMERGVCQYVASLVAAFQSQRIGNRIFYVVPIAIKGRNPTEVVISRRDARKLLAHAQTHNALRSARVVVVKPNP
ncbi:hypothetical protein [Thermospira aquatica]|uniref:Uncharacterized protein n=1 Tax=Thermospira aquatica TaxID=2828656 RepID=A0AAX3BFD2_9SPIR|nr:hypothetical protein [Thermospira aquatica]URA10984.1 hypothetical protein KDW03_04050 [Thermospira aquatica]